MPSTPSWLEPTAPWCAPVPPSLCAGLAVAPEEVPIVEVLGAPCSVAEVIAVRAGRFVPLFGHGATRIEAVRGLANIARAFGNDSDPRAADYALDMASHSIVGPAPLRALAQGANDGSADPILAELAVAYIAVLGASDAQRERITRELTDAKNLSIEIALALGAGGGDFGTYREHYAMLSAASKLDAPALRVARAWFDFVLARRFGGYDALQAAGTGATLDPASLWLRANAEHLYGNDRARVHMAEIAESILAPLQTMLPRLVGVVARELAEIVAHPMGMRFHHLRCAAARDHAAAAIRAWLVAATETEPEELPPELLAELGPEPTRAGRAAIEARTLAGEFLLDWFVPDRPAREAVDGFARRSLRIYHRLRGAQLLARIERELRPPGGMLTEFERIVWGDRGA